MSISKKSGLFNYLNDAQLHAELEKCASCDLKPCRDACPCHCDPNGFILAAKSVGADSDIQLAAAHIMSMNPFGGVCGAVCPDTFCMASCTRKDIDGPVNIPAVQAAIVHRANLAAKELEKAEGSNLLSLTSAEPMSSDTKIAVIGGGPSGCACASVLARRGYNVTIFEKREELGGACNTIPKDRLPRDLLQDDIDWVKRLGNIEIKTNSEIKDPEQLLTDGFKAVCIATGLYGMRTLGITNEKYAYDAVEFLWNPDKHPVGKKVAIIGGGAVGVDAAHVALERGAKEVICFYRRSMGEMPLTEKERAALFDLNITVIGRTMPKEIKIKKGKIDGLVVHRVDVPHKSTGKSTTKVVPNSELLYGDIDTVIYAIGNLPTFREKPVKGLFFAGDVINGASTVVQASAHGKNIAQEIDKFVSTAQKEKEKRKKQAGTIVNPPMKSHVQIEGYDFTPVSLETEFFGYKIKSPYLLSAAPLTDGYNEVTKAYEAGWPGVIMKTAFDGIPIHIPNHYMEKFNDNTYGNSDNVSGHPLERVCGELKKLIKEWPDRLTMASTGGPVSGDDEFDKKGWQSNTLKLEKAGAMGVEYSLSCPQGGDSGSDNTSGTIVSQNPLLAAKIIDWVMQVSDPKIPKIFKLTGAVTSIQAVLVKIKEVFDRYPHKKAGITLANSFPGATFREHNSSEEWEKTIVMGLSGEGVTPISNLTLCDASSFGLTISGNGGPFDYKAACNFLALGCKTVQFCTLPTKLGVDIIDELEEATSHMMRRRGIASIKDLIGRALPNPVVDFMDLSPVKQISSVKLSDCIHCGNCVRCPYQAISMSEGRTPVIDPSKCISCGVCTQQCPGLALVLRDRTTGELKVCPD